MISRHIELGAINLLVHNDADFDKDLAYSFLGFASIGGVLWGMEFIGYSSTILTLIVAYLAYRSNKTTERIAKLQVIVEAMTVAKTLRFQPLMWSGHAKAISKFSYETVQEACRECDRLKVYFSRDAEVYFETARNSALEFLANTVQPLNGIYQGDVQDIEEDHRLSGLRQTASDSAESLLAVLQEARQDNKIKI
ncbi:MULTISPECIES: hypothetical protein [Idiomarina]|uniref:hypothetical protein n=1 Tax=Idiomarina TaxID=135575 RepID=UPI000C093C60|nr:MULTISPECIES: hypothetical protein [Idiomarina]MAC35657.1 hypothetical protein [Haliea sp.]